MVRAIVHEMQLVLEKTESLATKGNLGGYGYPKEIKDIFYRQSRSSSFPLRDLIDALGDCAPDCQSVPANTSESTINQARLASRFFDDSRCYCLLRQRFVVFGLMTGVLNHSCAPNAFLEVQDPEGKGDGDITLTVRALQHIQRGQEITMSYTDDLGQSIAAHRMELKRAFGFDCLCNLCLLSESDANIRDLRNTCYSLTNDCSDIDLQSPQLYRHACLIFDGFSALNQVHPILADILNLCSETALKYCDPIRARYFLLYLIWHLEGHVGKNHDMVLSVKRRLQVIIVSPNDKSATTHPILWQSTDEEICSLLDIMFVMHRRDDEYRIMRIINGEPCESSKSKTNQGGLEFSEDTSGGSGSFISNDGGDESFSPRRTSQKKKKKKKKSAVARAQRAPRRTFEDEGSSECCSEGDLSDGGCSGHPDTAGQGAGFTNETVRDKVALTESPNVQGHYQASEVNFSSASGVGEMHKIASNYSSRQTTAPGSSSRSHPRTDFKAEGSSASTSARSDGKNRWGPTLENVIAGGNNSASVKSEKKDKAQVQESNPSVSYPEKHTAARYRSRKPHQSKKSSPGDVQYTNRRSHAHASRTENWCENQPQIPPVTLVQQRKHHRPRRNISGTQGQIPATDSEIRPQSGNYRRRKRRGCPSTISAGGTTQTSDATGLSSSLAQVTRDTLQFQHSKPINPINQSAIKNEAKVPATTIEPPTAASICKKDICESDPTTLGACIPVFDSTNSTGTASSIPPHPDETPADGSNRLVPPAIARAYFRPYICPFAHPEGMSKQIWLTNGVTAASFSTMWRDIGHLLGAKDGTAAKDGNFVLTKRRDSVVGRIEGTKEFVERRKRSHTFNNDYGKQDRLKEAEVD